MYSLSLFPLADNPYNNHQNFPIAITWQDKINFYTRDYLEKDKKKFSDLHTLLLVLEEKKFPIVSGRFYRGNNKIISIVLENVWKNKRRNDLFMELAEEFTPTLHQEKNESIYRSVLTFSSCDLDKLIKKFHLFKILPTEAFKRKNRQPQAFPYHRLFNTITISLKLPIPANLDKRIGFNIQDKLNVLKLHNILCELKEKNIINCVGRIYKSEGNVVSLVVDVQKGNKDNNRALLKFAQQLKLEIHSERKGAGINRKVITIPSFSLNFILDRITLLETREVSSDIEEVPRSYFCGNG